MTTQAGASVGAGIAPDASGTATAPAAAGARGRTWWPGAVPRGRRVTTWWTYALVAVPTAALFVLGYRRRWICDDGLIYLRPVRQILAGHGPVFNVGERAESSTGALWQWLLTLVTWVSGTDPAFLAVGLGLALSTAGYGLALWTTCRLHGGPASARLLVPAGILVLLAVPPFWSYMTSGLESGLGTFWTGLAWWLLVRTWHAGGRTPGAVGASTRTVGARTRWGPYVTAGAFGLGWLVRPDLLVVSVCFLAAQWWLLRPAPARAARLLGAAALVPFAYEVFRAGYYGVLLPLPAIAKEAGASDWGRGARYVQETMGPYWIWPAATLMAKVAVQRVRATLRAERHGSRLVSATGPTAGRAGVVLLAPVAAGTLLTLYVMRVGGDYMHARMILPALFLLLLPFLAVPATRLAGAMAGLLLVWLALAVSPLRQPYDLRGSATTFNVRSSDVGYTHDHNPVRSATWVHHWPRLPNANAMVAQAVHAGRPTLLYFDAARRLHATPMPAGSRYHVVMVGRHLGVTGAAVPLDDYVNDAWGLASPIGAHLALERWAWPGHEKFLRNHWVFADWAPPAPDATDLRRAGVTRADLRAARAALHCGPLAELNQSVRAPLTPSRFWHNLTGAWDRTLFRFARAPQEARAELCGTDRKSGGSVGSRKDVEGEKGERETLVRDMQ